MKYQNRVRLGQNRISHLFLAGSDLGNREQEVLEDASKRLGFIPHQLLDRSNWWNSKEIGAFRYEGKFKNKKACPQSLRSCAGRRAVLKIQGVKPATSEAYMIQAFSKANRSKILRPPLLYAYLPWDEEKRYEALILEFIDGKPIVGSPATESELEEFFNLRAEYKNNCTIDPWIEKPKESLAEEIKTNFEKWRQASFRLYPTHPFRKESDSKLIDEAVEVLARNYEGVKTEFQHGHFGVSDLHKNKNGQAIILSNLYWSWKPPFYDAVFGYHWFILNLAKLKNMTAEIIEQQKDLWLAKIDSLAKTDSEKKVLNLALLERAAAGLNLDALSVDSKRPVAEYLISQTRENLKSLLHKV